MTLRPSPTEPLNRDTIYCTKRKRFYSQFVPFIRYWGRVQSHKSRQLMEKRDLSEAGRSRGKELEDLNVFFQPFLSSPSPVSLWEKVVIALRRRLFLSDPPVLSVLSPRLPEGTSSKFGMRSPCLFVSPETFGGTHFSLTQTPQRQMWQVRRWRMQRKKRWLRKGCGWKLRYRIILL